MSNRVAAKPMTLSDLQVHSPTASLFHMSFFVNPGILDKIATEIARSMDPLR